MTTRELTPLFEDTDFNAPLSDARAAALIGSLGALGAGRVVDIGCGWGELLLRTALAQPAITAVGVDTAAGAIDHATALARERGLTGRVTFEVADAGDWSTPGPIAAVLNIGSTHVFGGEPVEHTVRALDRIRALLEPGGLALFGECFWEQPPSAAARDAMGIPVDQYRSLADLVELTAAHGFELVNLSQASVDEWDTFESRHALAYIRHLQRFPDAANSPAIRESHQAHRRFWLRGTRGTLGFVYLTLLAV